jgi:glycerol-3-phosphate acyltransferase PlsX
VESMNIAVDAMGGDHAPQAVVEGALLAEAALPVGLILTGDEYQLQDLLGPASRSPTILVAHAPETVGTGEAGPVALRKKRKFSLSAAMPPLAEGKADTLVSAGNSAAIVATGKHYPGLRQPAIAIPLPIPDGQVLLLDRGAHDQVNSVQLVQCAILADACLKATANLAQPRLGLLNSDTEPTKGIAFGAKGVRRPGRWSMPSRLPPNWRKAGLFGNGDKGRRKRPSL